MKNNKAFSVPGMYHKLRVEFISPKTMKSFNNNGDVIGNYMHNEGLIYVQEGLTPEVRRHTFYHEISHHVDDTLSEIKNVENRCDLLSAYLIVLAESRESIEAGLSLDNKK